MDSLLSFPVGLFHPLQHAGLSRRSPDGRPFGKVAEQLGDALAARRPDKRMPIRVDLVEMG